MTPSFTQKMNDQAAHLLQATVGNATEKRYNSHWKHWEAFKSQYISDPPDESIFMEHSTLTSKIRTLCAFVAFLHSHQSLRASTMVGTMAGIRHTFRSALFELDPFADARLTAVKHAVIMVDKKAGLSKANRKLPFTLDMVQHLLQISDLSNVHFHMCAVAVQLSYFGLYRSSEIVHDSEAELHHEEHALRTSDVVFFIGTTRKEVPYSQASSIQSFNDIDSMKLTLRSAKNDQMRRGKKTFFTARNLNPDSINIVKVMYDWAIRSKTQEGGILLSHWDANLGCNKHLTYDNLSNTVKMVASKMGFDKSRFAAHSPRIGGASTLRACRAPEPYIQLMGHWDSAATPLSYEEDNIREFLECQHILALSAHYSSEVVRTLQNRLLSEPSGPSNELDLCSEAI